MQLLGVSRQKDGWIFQVLGRHFIREGVSNYGQAQEGNLQVLTGCANKSMLPSGFRAFNSMEDVLERYDEVCRDIPQGALDDLNCGSITQKHIIFDTPCHDPKFLYSIIRLADMRCCVLSTGVIAMCLLKHTATNVMSRKNGRDDCAWALRGLHVPTILRPKGEEYEYCGPVMLRPTFLQDQGAKRRGLFFLWMMRSPLRGKCSMRHWSRKHVSICCFNLNSVQIW